MANTQISSKQRDIIAADALHRMEINAADALITSCPLCKKTLSKTATIPVIDIAQLVVSSMIPVVKEEKISARQPLHSKVIAN